LLSITVGVVPPGGALCNRFPGPSDNEYVKEEENPEQEGKRKERKKESC
jgi:hypothetical protein